MINRFQYNEVNFPEIGSDWSQDYFSLVNLYNNHDGSSIYLYVVNYNNYNNNNRTYFYIGNMYRKSSQLQQLNIVIEKKKKRLEMEYLPKNGYKLTKMHNNIYLISETSISLYKCYIIKNSIHLKLLYFKYSELSNIILDIQEDPDYHYILKLFCGVNGKNTNDTDYNLIDIRFINYPYYNQNYNKGIIFEYKSQTIPSYRNLIEFNDFIIDDNGSYFNYDSFQIENFGTNYGIMPQLCYTCPILERTDGTKLSIGSLRIINNNNKIYSEGSNIYNFRKKLLEDINNIDNLDYIYMLFFYIEDNSNIMISDAYLIYENSQIYMLTPMGISKSSKGLIIISCKDMYNKSNISSLLFNEQEIVNSCIYPLTNLDFRKFKYHILSKYN